MAEGVLIVGDPSSTLNELERALTAAGYTVRVEALDKLDDLPLDWAPCCTLVDLLGAGGDPVAKLTQALRARGLPTLILGFGTDGQVSATDAFRLGVDDFLRTPVEGGELLARVSRLIEAGRRLEQLSESERVLKVVVELTQLMASAADVRAAFAVVTRAAAQLTRAERVSVVLVRQDDNMAYVLCSSDDASLSDLPVALSSYPELRKCLDDRRSLVVEDATTSPLFATLPARPKFQSSAAVPILDERQTYGVLFFRSLSPGAFAPDRIAMFETLAKASGGAVHNARLLRSLRTETRQQSEVARTAARRLRVLKPYAEFFRQSADGMLVLEPRGRVLFANPVARKLAAVEGSIEGLNVGRYIPESERERARQLAEGFVRGEYPKGVDLKVITPGGEVVLNINSSATLRAEGAVLITFRDVTKERELESELTQTSQFLERVIESSVDAIVSADRSGTVRLFNGAAARVFGYDPKDVVGQMNVTDLYPPGVARDVMRRIRTGDNDERDRLRGHQVNMQDSSGRLVPTRLSASLIHDDDGRVVGSVGIFTDLRNELRMKARLRQARDEIQAHEKSVAVAQLAGATAHELNQPLTSVLGYADLLARRLEDPQLRHAASVIVDQAERMATIVRQIGRITRYETKTYVGATSILDLERSSETPPDEIS